MRIMLDENEENVYGKFTEWVGLFLTTIKIAYRRKLKIKWPILASFFWEV